MALLATLRVRRLRHRSASVSWITLKEYDATFLYDPAIEKPSIVPMVECPDDFVEISLANGDEVKGS